MNCKRNYHTGGGTAGLDWLKLFLSFLIVLRHCGQNYYLMGSNNPFFIVIVSGISTIGVPTFFLISGFLFYRKNVDVVRLKRQLLRILLLYLTWSIIYLPLQLYSQLSQYESWTKAIIIYFQKFIFDGSYYHLWYLPSLMFGLLISYYLNRLIHNRYLLFGIYICLFIIALLGDSYRQYIPNTLEKIIENYESVFLTTRNGLFIGVPFIGLGKLLADKWEFLTNKRISFWSVTTCLFLIGVVAEAWLITKDGRVNNILLMDFPAALCLVNLFCCIRFKKKTYLKERQMSTAIYCIHPLCILLVTIGIRFFNFGLSLFEYCLYIIAITIMASYIGLLLRKHVKILKYAV